MPTIVNAIKIHHALLLMSWSRRHDTAKFGIRVARLNIGSRGPPEYELECCEPNTAESIIESAKEARVVNSTQYQYSLRLARPLKSVYLLNPDWIASVKFIFFIILMLILDWILAYFKLMLRIYSPRRASIGFLRAAFRAGATLKIIPTPIEIATANIIIGIVMAGCRPV
jgi:hypothetical protein